MSGNLQLHVSHQVFIQCSPEAVWDYTQDFAKRTEWDKSISTCTLLDSPIRKAQVRSPFLCAVLEYKEFDRPNKTSLKMSDVESYFIEGGGGSWQYVAKEMGTLWTQSNTLILRPSNWNWLLRPLIRWSLSRNTKRSMQRSKRILEQGFHVKA